MLRVLFWSPVPYARDAVLEALQRCEGVEWEMVTEVDACVEKVAGADLLVLGDAPEPVARRVLAAASAEGSALRGLHFISAGRDGFEAAGIPETLEVGGAEGANAPTVAEHALALTLALMRRTGRMAIDTQSRNWDRSHVRALRSLEGQTVLIVGLGRIGGEAALRFRSFGAKVIGLTRTGAPNPEVAEIGRIADLDSYLPTADVVVVTAALTSDTRHLINAERLAAMRESALFINVSRGGLVDHDALANALSAGSIAAAGLDVTDPEPLPSDHPLWESGEVLISPHVAGGGSRAVSERVGRSVEDRVNRLAAEMAGTAA